MVLTANGLYFFDTVTETKSKQDVTPYSFLETVKDNKQYFSNQEIKGAESARLGGQAPMPSKTSSNTI
jgi:hypothetical protein